ncbi:MAG: TRAP-type C4-dicarboxylate transport system, large permease component, partial [Rhodospirillales bacterium]|nr:TRAP-type C4-dicarboxylate transport system, large permease component [Rhodospirillales bacterium]
MLVLAILTVIEISLRFFFDTPIRGLNDAVNLLMAVVIVATFPVGIMARSHITIDLFKDALGPRFAKLGEGIGAVLFLFFIAFLAWRLGVYADRLVARQDSTMVGNIPTGPFWWGVTAILVSCLPFQMVVIARIWTELRDAFSTRRGAPPVRRGEWLRGGSIVIVCVVLTAALYVAIGKWGAGAGPANLALLGFAAVWVPLMILMPIGAAMAIVGLIGTAVLTNSGAALSTFAIQTASFLGNANTSVLPLFLMMGSFAAVAGVSDDVYAIAHALLGRWRGGLAMATIGGCAGF